MSSPAKTTANHQLTAAYRHGVPKTTWLNYKRTRIMFGAKEPTGELFRTHRISPNTTFRWVHPEFDECIRQAWYRASAACQALPCYMRDPNLFYPIIHEVFGVSKEDILRDIRDVTVSRTRHVLMWLMFAHGVDIATIRKSVCKDYTVVVYALNKNRVKFEEAIGVAGRKHNHNGRLTSYGQKERRVSPQLHGTVRGDSGSAQA